MAGVAVHKASFLFPLACSIGSNDAHHVSVSVSMNAMYVLALIWQFACDGDVEVQSDASRLSGCRGVK